MPTTEKWQSPQFYARIGGEEVPMNLGLSIVPVAFPSSDVAWQRLQVGNSPVQALPVEGAKLDLRHIEPTTVLGRVVDFETLCQSPGLFRGKRLVERRHAVRVQVIHDQAYADGIGVAFVEHAFDPPRPVFCSSVFGGCHTAFAGQWFYFDKDLGNAIADVLMVHTCRSSRRASYRFVHFSDKLFAAFIHTDHRIVDVVRQLVDGKDVFHIGYERGVPVRRDFPVLPEMRLKFVFFSVRCTV
ncbi:MAG: hypothetical protein Q7R39_02085, partial [Dehalococcoidia bacterium]|nr:hypothetical protein [Dehalococcoidia bacterium]